MLKYISVFVLVMLMVKTDAHEGYYYYKSTRVDLTQNNSMLLIRATNSAQGEESQLLELLENDSDFDIIVNGVGGYFLLERKAGSMKTDEEAINYYVHDPAVTSVLFTYQLPDGTLMGVSNQIAVKLNDGAEIGTVVNLMDEGALISYKQHRYYPDIYYLNFSKEAAFNLLEIAVDIYESGICEFSEPIFFSGSKPDGLVSSSCSFPTPAEPLYQHQWALYNPGGILTAYGINAVAHEDISACHAWNTTDYEGTVFNIDGQDHRTGYRVKVAVIDQGVDNQHPDLDGNVLPGYQTIPATGWPGAPASPPFNGQPGSPSFANHHGTQCAGIIAAEHDASGMAGIAYNAEILPVRSFYHHVITNTHFYDASWVADGIDVSVIDEGVDVINCSWSAIPHSLIDNSLDNATANGRDGKGCVVVFSVGNENRSTINYPSSNPNVIAVGASTMCSERKRSYHDQEFLDSHDWVYDVEADPDSVSCDDEWWWGSNYGKGPGYGTEDWTTSNYLSVVAPGVKIYAPKTGYIHAGTSSYVSGGHTPDFSGTSAAAPHVAGVVALMLSVNPCLIWTEVKHIIHRTADKIPGPAANPYTWTGSFLTPGDPDGTWVDQVGYGRLNAGNAVARAHDMYRQDESVNLNEIYTSYNRIFAGEDIDPTGTMTTGAYTISSGANISYQAVEGIRLTSGFHAQSGSSFIARIIDPPCDNNDVHYKQPRDPETVYVTSGALGEGKSFQDIRIYPNPVSDRLNISFALTEESSVSIAVVNILGQEVIQQTGKTLSAGQHEEFIRTDGLKPGIFLIRVETNQSKSQFRFVKE